MIGNNTARRAVTHDNMTATLAQPKSPVAPACAPPLRPEMRGNLGKASRHLESGHERLAHTLQRKLLQIELRSLPQIGDSFRHALALFGRARLGVERNESALLGGNQDCGQKHGTNVSRAAPESTTLRNHSISSASNENKMSDGGRGRVSLGVNGVDCQAST